MEGEDMIKKIMTGLTVWLIILLITSMALAVDRTRSEFKQNKTLLYDIWK